MIFGIIVLFIALAGFVKYEFCKIFISGWNHMGILTLYLMEEAK